MNEGRKQLNFLPDEFAPGTNQGEAPNSRGRRPVGRGRVDVDSAPEIGALTAAPVEPFLKGVDPLAAAAVGVLVEPRIVDLVASLAKRQHGLVLVTGIHHLSARGVTTVLTGEAVGLQFVLNGEEPGSGHHAGQCLNQVTPLVGQDEERAVVADILPEPLEERWIKVDAP